MQAVTEKISHTEWALPADWARCGTYRFERELEHWLPDGTQVVIASESLKELERALAAGGPVGVRAAVIAGRSADPAATELLIARLEQRAVHAVRADDAADVVAAAALSRVAPSPELAARLAALAGAPGAHPDLEVRVECASSALLLGADGVVPFLMTVLRTDTPDAEPAREDWEPTETLAWAKSRAADALSRRAGLPADFSPDASYADQAARARALAAALRNLGVNPEGPPR